MLRFPAIFLALGLSFLGTQAQAQGTAADLYTVSGVKVDATAESSTAARDAAMAQGRPIAWQQLYRKLTPPANWPKQPQLDDGQLQRIIRSFEVANEKRSTTRYLADVTFHFNPDAVRRVLRQSSVAYTETQSKPFLVIPSVNGGNADTLAAWTLAWSDPSVAEGLVPVMVPPEAATMPRADLPQTSWALVAPLASKYDAAGVVIAETTPGATTAKLTQIAPGGRQTLTVTATDSSFLALAQASASKLSESWRDRSAVDYSQKYRLTASASFASLQDWNAIRREIGNVKSITDFSVQGLALREAKVDLTYYGKEAQLKDALAQQNLVLEGTAGDYTLRLANRP